MPSQISFEHPNTKFNKNPFGVFSSCYTRTDRQTNFCIFSFQKRLKDIQNGTQLHSGRIRLKCNCTCAETKFRLSTKRTSPFKSARASVQSTTGSRGVRISGTNAGYTVFRGSVKSTGYPLHLPVSPSLPLPCVTVGHHVSNAV